MITSPHFKGLLTSLTWVFLISHSSSWWELVYEENLAILAQTHLAHKWGTTPSVIVKSSPQPGWWDLVFISKDVRASKMQCYFEWRHLRCGIVVLRNYWVKSVSKLRWSGVSFALDLILPVVIEKIISADFAVREELTFPTWVTVSFFFSYLTELFLTSIRCI